MVCSLTLCPDDAKQDPVQEDLDCLGLYHSGLEGEHFFRLVVELT